MRKTIGWIAFFALVGWLIWQLVTRKAAPKPPYTPVAPPMPPVPPITPAPDPLKPRSPAPPYTQPAEIEATTAVGDLIAMLEEPKSPPVVSVAEPTEAVDAVEEAIVEEQAEPEMARQVGGETLYEAPAAVPALSSKAAPEADQEGLLPPLDAYCVRCREHRTLVDAHEEITQNGRRAARGTCPVCGAKVFRFLSDKTE